MTIECGSNLMTKIVFNVASKDSTTSNLTGSLTAAGFTFTVNGRVVTVTFDEPIDKFELVCSTGKVFLDSITVIAQASGGETPDPTPDSAIVENWGLTLNDEIVVKFNMNFTEEILADEDAYVEVKVGNTTKNVPVSQVTGPLQVAVDAAQMTEKITLCVVDGNGESSETDSFTVRQYCDTILGDEEYAKYHDLVKEMLNYGSAAQLYFGKNTGDLAGEGITDAGQQEVPTTGGEYVLEGHIEGVECYGATLVHRDKIGLRYYFTGDLTGCTFAVNGVPTELQIGTGNYVELADILPQDLDEDVNLVVTDANGNTINVTYCPMNYIIRMNQKGTDATKAVVKALYNYHLAAKDFSGS